MKRKWRSKRRVLYLQFTNPGAYPPLQHSALILAERGWSVVALGRHVEGLQAIGFPVHPEIHVRMMRVARSGLTRKLQYVGYLSWAFLYALWFRPAWVYASDALSALPALLIGSLLRRRVLYHEHDIPVRHRTWRKALARRASVVVLPNETRRAHFVAECRPKVEPHVVWNCGRREEVLRRARAPGTAPELRLIFQGSIVPARVPLTLLSALVDLPVRLDVVGYGTVGHPTHPERLRETARALGIVDRFFLHGPMGRREMLDKTRLADVGVSLMPSDPTDFNERHMTGASNKPFDYLSCGVALLVPDREEWNTFFVDTAFGVACRPEDPESIRRALRWFLDHPAERLAMGERGRQRCLEDWNYETQFAPVLEKLELTLPGSKA